MAMIRCGNCGAELDDSQEFCPNCGNAFLREPTEEAEPGTPQKSEPTESEPTGEEVTKTASKKKIIVIFACVAIVVVAVIVAIAVIVSQGNRAKRLEAYSDYLNEASYTMLSGCADAETAGNLIKQVWYDAIYEEFNVETYKYTQGCDDFNDALHNLFQDSDFQVKIAKIRDNQEEVTALMKELRDPPEKYEEAYDQIREYYDTYLEFTDMVIDPTGSFTTFSSNFNDADNRAVKEYRTMKLYLDD